MTLEEQQLTFTHTELVKVAIRWLRTAAVINGRNVRCGIVAGEIRTSSTETPDAIGWWCGRHTVIVECKVSRADYYRDKRKSFRREPKRGAGKFRYYLTPPDLLVPKTLPEGWGLIEWTGTAVVVVREAMKQEQNEHGRDSDMCILASLFRRGFELTDETDLLRGGLP